MTKNDTKGCRQRLEAKRRELLSGRLDTAGIVIERVPDSMEEFSLEVEQSLAVDALDRKISLLRQVTEALERISGGNYGECLACEQPISPKRLAALPWAELCIECQQATENNRMAEAKLRASPRLGYKLSHRGAQPAGQLGRHDPGMPRPGVPHAAPDGGAAESEARV